MIPEFFAKVAAETAKRWDQLDSDPELAAPWKQLFRQVQSPRHVLSELLQNAEDASATWARASITKGKFVFEYDGKDFDEDSFRSLCRFGYSNKRSLHTIGFRGIGFKTTFSLGQVVRVDTPTLSFEFDSKRFTLPILVDRESQHNYTRISVQLDSPEKEKAIGESFKEWLASPLPLIFFDNLTKLEIAGEVIEKLIDRDGPVENSEWVYLSTKPEELLLRIWSKDENFPDECVLEVRQERGDEDFDPAPCKVELILGANSGRIYTVLPTHVQPNLPFVSNGPFIQDPSRYRIKAPEISETNQWLLRRLGVLAGSSTLKWLKNETLTQAQRARAYELLPEAAAMQGNSPDAAICKVVLESFKDYFGQPILLSSSGALIASMLATDVPAPFVSIWGAGAANAIFSLTNQECLSPDVDSISRDRLADWDLIERITSESVSTAFRQRTELPRPLDDEKLIDLWEQIFQIDQSRSDRHFRRSYPIIPIRGTTKLIHSKSAAFILERDSALSDEDHALLLKFLDVVDLPFIQMLDQKIENDPDDVRLQSAKQMRPSERPTSMQEALEQATREAFRDPVQLFDRLELTRFAARNRLNIERERMPSFRLLTRGGFWATVNQVVYPRKGDEFYLFPEHWLNDHAISDEYVFGMTEGEADRFWDWLISSNGGIKQFPAPTQIKQRFYAEYLLNDLLKERGAKVGWSKSASSYELEDYDWPEDLRNHWNQTARTDIEIWSRIVDAFGHTFKADISKFQEARAGRIHGAVARDIQGGIPSSWLHRLRGLPCLIEERSQEPTLPALLLRRTPQTEPLLNIEKFVFRNLDGPDMAPLLDALGVRREPQNAATILTRLEALSSSSEPPLTHLLDLYRALDSISTASDDSKQAAMQSAFLDKSLIYGSDGKWFRSNEVFQGNDDGLDGLPTIHPELRGLRLWDAVQVPKFASFEALESWIKSIKPFTVLNDKDRKQAQAVLGHFPREIYNQFSCWLSCQGEWLPLDHLKYFSANSTSTNGLFNQFKSESADFSILPPSIALELAKGRPEIEEAIEYTVRSTTSSQSDSPPWLTTMSECILRIQDVNSKLNDDLDQDRATARQMYGSSWISASEIVVTPQIEGVQAGPEARRKSLWSNDGFIYVSGTSASYHKELAETLVSKFLIKDIREAIRDSIGREPSWVEERFTSQFTLGPLPLELPLTVVLATQSPRSAPDETAQIEKFEKGVDNGEDHISSNQSSTDEIVSEAATKAKPREEESTSQAKPLHCFLFDKGFEWDATRGLYANRETGEVVKRESGSAIPWSKYSEQGVLTKRYFEASATLNHGIEIKAEAWMMIEARPDHCCIVGPGDGNEVYALDGDSLKNMRSNGWISVAATGYRLRVETEHQRKI